MSNGSQMRVEGHSSRVAVVAVTLLAIGGCAHVNRDELTMELDQVRAEMRQGDEAVESRLAAEIEATENRMATRIASLEGSLRALEGEFDVVLERFDEAIRFSAPVHFAFDNATVRTEDYRVLDRFAGVVRDYYADATITVEGFTDSAGSAAYNQRLGEARARSVMEYLADSGIPTDRMRAVSYGASADRQIIAGAQGPGEAGWQNRRVAMVIDFGASGPPSVALDQGSEDR